ncbi:hypothetical protein K474DRAFT_197716 [Panus rudis PR-1116 ss-1]|nr:hypothetical protein K474DRAFT_197716 [Panus rudis PR-1116 ss-1]
MAGKGKKGRGRGANTPRRVSTRGKKGQDDAPGTSPQETDGNPGEDQSELLQSDHVAQDAGDEFPSPAPEPPSAGAAAGPQPPPALDSSSQRAGITGSQSGRDSTQSQGAITMLPQNAPARPAVNATAVSSQFHAQNTVVSGESGVTSNTYHAQTQAGEDVRPRSPSMMPGPPAASTAAINPSPQDSSAEGRLSASANVEHGQVRAILTCSTTARGTNGTIFIRGLPGSVRVPRK